MAGYCNEREYTAPASSFRFGRIPDIGVGSPNRPIPAINRGTGCPNSRPLYPQEQKFEARISSAGG